MILLSAPSSREEIGIQSVKKQLLLSLHSSLFPSLSFCRMLQDVKQIKKETRKALLSFICLLFGKFKVQLFNKFHM